MAAEDDTSLLTIVNGEIFALVTALVVIIVLVTPIVWIPIVPEVVIVPPDKPDSAVIIFRVAFVDIKVPSGNLNPPNLLSIVPQDVIFEVAPVVPTAKVPQAGYHVPTMNLERSVAQEFVDQELVHYA